MSSGATAHIRNHLVVGVDGSAESGRAVRWAAYEAALRGLPLRVVHGFVWPAAAMNFEAPTYLSDEPSFHNAAQQVLAEAAETAREAVPDLTVETDLVEEAGGAAALLQYSGDAAILVVGDRGLGGFSGLIVGSIAVQLAMHAPCPVVVVRGGEPDPSRRSASSNRNSRIVVGVDASDHAAAALAFAFEEAAFRGAPLHALHAWTEPTSTGPGDMIPLVYDPELVQQEEARLEAELLAGWSEKYPDVVVTREVARGRARDTLIAASRDAQLLVVGARGVGGFRGLLFGSVSQAALHHADCPVAVVRP
ncbi:MAG: universal stress protein [Micromonosporaceae bacterium]